MNSFARQPYPPLNPRAEQALIQMLQSGNPEVLAIIDSYLPRAQKEALAVPSANTSNTPPSALPGDWNAVIQFLTNEGIRVSAIEWDSITSLCKKASTNLMEDMAQCQYRLAHQQYGHKRQAGRCWQQARLEFPDSFLHRTIELSRVATYGEDGSARETTVQMGPYRPEELAHRRTALFEECMHRSGWKDPFDWVDGRVE